MNTLLISQRHAESPRSGRDVTDKTMKNGERHYQAPIALCTHGPFAKLLLGGPGLTTHSRILTDTKSYMGKRGR